ncbi:hypothetical protein DPMN_181110 [Dreissena polymorpha]|uniref:Uncharacterized protein n=1 Tax=Dreissena polymorpha TaxID=45954 RepID=A0A9D4DC76_DREPO|nr:hypothetical protein DPMN_181110 [Dreissena polymorpha]
MCPFEVGNFVAAKNEHRCYDGKILQVDSEDHRCYVFATVKRPVSLAKKRRQDSDRFHRCNMPSFGTTDRWATTTNVQIGGRGQSATQD